MEKNAQETKGGAGQYFTPRPQIRAIVDVMHPAPGETICDPACGTGGFLLAAHEYILSHYPNLNRDQKRHLSMDALRGVEIVDNVTRLCATNLLLHGIGPQTGEGTPPVKTDDSLRDDPGMRFDLVLTNPPFGKKSSVLVVNEEGGEERQALTVVRDDFRASTSNKQLNSVGVASVGASGGHSRRPQARRSDRGEGGTVIRRCDHSDSQPCCSAYVTMSARLRKPSFFRARNRCVSTVFIPMPSLDAISVLV
jgi:hypothetical protein